MVYHQFFHRNIVWISGFPMVSRWVSHRGKPWNHGLALSVQGMSLSTADVHHVSAGGEATEASEDSWMFVGKTMGKPWPWGIWIIHRKNIVNLCKSSLKAMEVLPGHLDRAQFFGAPEGLHKPIQSLDWFLGENLQETMVFYHEIWGFPVKFSLKPTQWSKDAKEQFLDPAANTCRIIIPWGVGSKFTTDRGLCPSEVIVVKWGIRQQNHVGYGPKPRGSYLSVCLSIHLSMYLPFYLPI